MQNKMFTKNTRVCLIVSGSIIFVALILNIFGAGLNLGIDFTGGSLLEYSVGAEFSTQEVTDILNRHGYTDSQVAKAASGADGQGDMTNLQIRLALVDRVGDMKKAVEDYINPTATMTIADYRVLTSQVITEGEMDNTHIGGHQFMVSGAADADKLEQGVSEALSAKEIPFTHVHAEAAADGQTRLIVMLDDQSTAVRDILEAEMSEKYPDFTYVSIEHAGAVSSADLVRNALMALGIALALMLVYIAFRFDLYSGLAALFGLAHDILMMIAIMSFFRFAYQVNSSFIAAVLTIVGYSINNTIIIFDRVRENKKAGGKTPNIDIIETSVSQSFSRTINTTLTTLFTLVALYVLGVDSIQEFTFPLIVGMLSGAYSALLLNGPVWAFLLNKAESRKLAKAKAKA